MFLGCLKMFSVQVINTLYCHAAKRFHCQYVSYSKVGPLQLLRNRGCCWLRKEEVGQQISSYCAPPAFVDSSFVKMYPWTAAVLQRLY